MDVSCSIHRTRKYVAYKNDTQILLSNMLNYMIKAWANLSAFLMLFS